jgi:hypothetical protein
MTTLKVFIFAFNRPDLLQKQLDSFEKYLVGDYDINVVYDYREDSFGKQFKKICEDNNVNLYYHKSDPGNVPSEYHGQCINWVYSNLLEDGDYAIFLDHDMFLIDNFDLTNRLSKCDVLGHKQVRGDVVYLWPGLFAFNYSKIKHISLDFSPCIVNNESLDSGGGTFKIVEDQNINVTFFDQEYPDYYQDLNLKDSDVNNGFVFELFDNGTFLHTHNASHWHNGYEVNDKKKTEVIFSMLNQILTGCYDVDEGDLLMKEYHLFCNTPTEINEHLPTLFSLSKECSSIVELGVCHGKSTRALLASGTKLRSYDVWVDPRVLELFNYAKSIGRDVDYIKESSIKCEIDECDMLFIDTWHNYYQLKKELKLHANKVKKYLVFHDTMSCGSTDEGLECWGNGAGINLKQVYQDLDTDEFKNYGINSAIFEFLSENQNWVVKKHYKNNSGLTILERKNNG